MILYYDLHSKTEKHYKYLDEPYATFETIELDSALKSLICLLWLQHIYLMMFLFLRNNSDETIVIFDFELH